MNALRRVRETYVARLLRHRSLVFAVTAVLIVICGWRTVRTYQSLRSDLEELLPTTAPSVTSIAELRQRVPGLRYLGVVVDTGGPKNLAAAERFIADLSARARNYPKAELAAVRGDIREERRFAETYALQLLPPTDVRELRETIEQERDREVSRGLGMDLLEDDETAAAAASGTAAELRAKYEKRYKGPKYPGDKFVSADGHTRVLLLQAGSHATNYEADRKLLDRVQTDIEALGFPQAYASDMRVGYAGDVATRVEEMEGLATDLGISGALVSCLVVAAIWLFFRSWRALPILGIPMLLGTVLTFGLAALPPLSIRHLNSNTAFLASIIIGNGVNFGVILLARFVEERARGVTLEKAIEIAVSSTWSATLAAALAASAAYGSLVVTDFRGFNQFGWIGALGMVTCWGVTYVVAPPTLAWLGAGMQPRPERVGKSFTQDLLAGMIRRPRLVLGLSAVAVLFSIAGVASRYGDYLEYDLSTLRRRDSWESGERYWGKRMDATLKRYLTPTLIMTASAEDARLVEARVRELQQSNRAGGLIGSVSSGSTLLNPNREESIAEGHSLRAILTPRMKAELSPQDRELVERAISPAALRPLTPAQLPDVLVAGLREKDGRIDRNVLVYPKLGAGTWDAQRIHAFTADLREAAKVHGNDTPIAGSLLLSSDIASAISKDGPRMTLLALFTVLAICVLTFRSVGLSFAAVGSLLAGVLLMLGTLGWLGARLNFSNFVALPITFGIGADYSINVLKRFQSEGRASIDRVVTNTGGAVALCSVTTVIGYGSLLVAQNRALFSFGVLAVAGELACLLTAILGLPAALRFLQRESVEERESEPGDSGAIRSATR
ncbi:MAG TPA: MMPL family transporter [Polyangiaceae bacterium]|nr:MMPL family transporter [Polyangiaceae bacterium]